VNKGLEIALWICMSVTAKQIVSADVMKRQCKRMENTIFAAPMAQCTLKVIKDVIISVVLMYSMIEAKVYEFKAVCVNRMPSNKVALCAQGSQVLQQPLYWLDWDWLHSVNKYRTTSSFQD
jgi:hypothetical protein